MNRLYNILNKVLDSRRHRVIVDNYCLEQPLSRSESDYVRVSTLELFSREAYRRNIQGACAELGVYKGDFAKQINRFLPDRRLFLFDTFEGFDIRDLEDEDASFVKGGWNTSPDIVLGKMTNPEVVIIKSGYFPDTSVRLENERFCFVSLDADLYAPTKAGLEFFYPRLNPGGIIMVHDYNGKSFQGVRRACEEFHQRNGAGYVCIGDEAGTCVFAR